MKSTKDTLLDRGIDVARQSVLASVRTRYFPELWYILENWLFQKKQKRILAVGHGFGLIAEALAKSGWDVTVVDPSLTALTDMKARFDKEGLVGAFEQAEPDALPFANGSFAAVASINMLELSQNHYEAARELARVVAPGGRAMLATFNKLGPWGIPAIIRMLRPEDDKRTTHCVSKTELKTMLKTVGLKVEDVKDRAQYLPMVEARSLKLPVAGAYVALLTKPMATPASAKQGASSVRPRSRPSLSRKSPVSKKADKP